MKVWFPSVWQGKTVALALSGLITASVSAQIAVNLDTNPSFDFSDNTTADPLFTPGLLGLNRGQAAFAGVDALRAFAEEVSTNFPPGMEVFLAYWANPGYALLGGTPLPAAPLGAGSSLSLATAFRPSRVPKWGGPADLGFHLLPTITSERGAAFMIAEGTEVTLRGVSYELPAAMRTISPLVLDLDGDGMLGASRGLWLPHPAKLTGPYAAFDMDGDGFKDITEWIGGGDGLLVTTNNPTSGRDLVGVAGGWKDGFEHLAVVYDLDHNGRVEGAELAGLYVWRDLNSNGVADAGEVVPVESLGITWIAATNSGDYTASFGRVDSLPGLVWDWWPNYALALGRSTAAPSGSGVLVGQTAIHGFGDLLLDRHNPVAQPTQLTGPRHILPAQLAASGIDLSSFRIARPADGGNIVVAYDLSASAPSRVRLLQLQTSCSDTCLVARVELPFEQIFQLACDPSGRTALVLGNQGSKLVLVDFDRGIVAPPEGLDLGAIGLRASGLAGDPMVRFSGAGYFWFTAWQLDEQGAVVDERAWALTPWGFWGGLSLEALRHQWGQLRSYYLTGATSGFFATPTPGGANETLWWVWSNCDTCHVAVAQADSFGGMHAVDDQVSYTWRRGDLYGWDYWRSLCTPAGDTCHVAIATASVPYFYPFLTDGGGTAIAAQLDPGTGTLRYFCSSAPLLTNTKPLLDAYPGQGKVTRGALAHYGTNGIEVIPLPDSAPEPPSSQVWNYTLLPGSRLVDECPVCGHPPVIVPLRGTFQMRLIQENPLFSTYAWESLAWATSPLDGSAYKIVGQGLYQLGGEVGLLQDLSLTVFINNGWTNRLCDFAITNDVYRVTRPWPWIEVSADQTNGLPAQQYHLDLLAMPLREIWFSTAQGFHAGIWQEPTNYVSPGDLISSAGRVVKRNSDLTRRLGIMPIVSDLGLNGVDVLPGGEIAFAIERDAFSDTLGQLSHGDVFSDQGRILTSQAALIAAFGPEPPAPNEGLDALQMMPSGEVYFSITNDFFSERLGRLIRRGDLLSSAGVVVRSNEELVARFHPLDPKKDYGLDAIYVWPDGEIWFSVETGFAGEHFDTYEPGDLLSDQGYVVYSNSDLLAVFQPLDKLLDYGLDALFVVTDAVPSASPPRPLTVKRSPAEGSVTLGWEGQGRVFQVEKAADVLGPWLPINPISTDLQFTEDARSQPRAFYRVRQW